MSQLLLRSYASLARFAATEPADEEGTRWAEEFNSLLDHLSRQIGRDLSECKVGPNDVYPRSGGASVKPGRLPLRARQTLSLLNLLMREGKLRPACDRDDAPFMPATLLPVRSTPNPIA